MFVKFKSKGFTWEVIQFKGTTIKFFIVNSGSEEKNLRDKVVVEDVLGFVGFELRNGKSIVVLEELNFCGSLVANLVLVFYLYSFADGRI